MNYLYLNLNSIVGNNFEITRKVGYKYRIGEKDFGFKFKIAGLRLG